MRSLPRRLRHPAFIAEPRPERPGILVDATALGVSLEKPITHLTDALADVKREEREAQLTLKARNDATAAWNTRYQGIADTATGLFEAVGHADLADPVRPAARRRAGVAEAVDLPRTPPADPIPKG